MTEHMLKYLATTKHLGCLEHNNYFWLTRSMAGWGHFLNSSTYHNLCISKVLLLS